MVQRILIVEDDSHLLAVLGVYLAHEGFEAIDVDTGRAALAALTDGVQPVDLVVLDLGLPDVDGLEVLARVRTTSDVPVIIVTARSEEVDKLVWGYDFYGDERVVDVHIRGIRAALGDDATHPRFVGTVRGVGYRFVGRHL